MSAQLEIPAVSEQPVKTSVKVIVLVLGILGSFVTLCGIAVAIFYAVIPADLVPPGTSISRVHLGGAIIAGAIVLPGIMLVVIALALWFFLWRKNIKKTS